jgi:hypothetical protein
MCLMPLEPPDGTDSPSEILCCSRYCDLVSEQLAAPRAPVAISGDPRLTFKRDLDPINPLYYMSVRQDMTAGRNENAGSRPGHNLIFL